MGLLLDTSIITAAERGKLDLHSHLHKRGQESVAITTVNASELLHGIHRARTESQRTRREAFVEQVLQVLEVKPYDFVSARVHARLTSEMVTVEDAPSQRDLMVAAIALALGWSLATRDERTYRKIPGLQIEVW